MTEQFTDSRQCRTANVSQNMGSVPTRIITDDSLLNISAVPKQTAPHSKARGHCRLLHTPLFLLICKRFWPGGLEDAAEFECVYVRACQGDGFSFWQMPSLVPSRVSVVSQYSPFLSPVTKIVTVTHKTLHNSSLTQTRTACMRLSS